MAHTFTYLFAIDVPHISIAYVECHTADHALTLKNWFDNK